MNVRPTCILANERKVQFTCTVRFNVANTQYNELSAQYVRILFTLETRWYLTRYIYVEKVATCRRAARHVNSTRVPSNVLY